MLGTLISVVCTKSLLNYRLVSTFSRIFFPNSSSNELRFSRDCIPAISMEFSVQNTEVTKGWFV